MRHCRPLEYVCRAAASHRGDMLEAMKHRGPDASGTLEYAGGAAGMVRLALVDLSPRGQQPMWSAGRRVAIVFNGEIYNFRARARSPGSGRSPLSHDDRHRSHPESLPGEWPGFSRTLAGHVRAGHLRLAQNSPGKLPIMVLVRGPLGIKHLYVAHPHGRSARLIFSSEMRAPPGLGPGVARGELRGARDLPGTWLRGAKRYDPYPACG